MKLMEFSFHKESLKVAKNDALIIRSARTADKKEIGKNEHGEK